MQRMLERETPKPLYVQLQDIIGKKLKVKNGRLTMQFLPKTN
jgi:hypothetical protein